jgi:cob(I)alamin adenosyltransferase
MKIYTKKGDRGETSLLGGSKVSKSHLRIECYGTVDELNSNVGLLRSFWENDLDNIFLESIQNQLFNLGSLLALGESKKSISLPQIEGKQISEIEVQIDLLEAKLQPLKTFVLPYGSTPSAQAHVCRCVCRRAERLCVSLNEMEEIDQMLIAYLNRLSDYFFVLARKILADENIADKPWAISNLGD